MSIEKTGRLSVAAIKKILAGKGDLDGNFYAVPSDRINEGGLVVTLLARDPKGSRARGLGKTLLKEFKTTDMARGRVLFFKGKLYFEVHKAKALPGPKLKKSLRNGMGDDKLKKYLKTSLVGSPNENKDDDGEDGLSEDELGALADEVGDLSDLTDQQERILSLGDTLKDFLSDLDDDTAAAKTIRETSDAISDIEEAIALADGRITDTQAHLLVELRIQLAEAKAITDDLDPSSLPSVGEVLDDDLLGIAKGSVLLLLDIDLDDGDGDGDEVVLESEGLSSLSKALSGEDPDDEDRSSPFSGTDGAIRAGGRRIPTPFPPRGWATKMAKAAAKRKPGLLASSEVKQLHRDKRSFRRALAGSDDPISRGVLLARELSASMSSDFAGKVAGRKTRGPGERPHPDEARIQRATLAVQAMVNAGDVSVQGDREALLFAVCALSEAQQLDLLRADLASGKKLYSALYQAAKENPALKAEFAAMKRVAQQAEIVSKLDEDDRTGESSKLLGGMLDHIEKAGIPEEQQRAFIDKMAFKLKLRASQGSHPDIPSPKTDTAGWRAKMTGRMISTLAETPEISDESLLKALDMPAGDLMKVLGSALTGDQPDPKGTGTARREGDFRLLRLAKALAAQHAEESEGWADLKRLLDGLESGAFDRDRFSALAGGDLSTILETLQSETDKEVEETTAKVTALDDNIAARIEALEAELDKLPDEDKRDGAEKSRAAAIARELEKLEELDDAFGGISWDEETIGKLTARFGRRALSMLDGALSGDKDTPFPSNATVLLSQLKVQIDAIEDPRKLKAGLEKMALVLPTAGRYLKDCSWVYSTAQDLVETAKLIQTVEDDFRLTRYPIIILDQTDGDQSNPDRVEKWNVNQDYLAGLEKAHAAQGLAFKHVSMGDINAMIRGSGVEKMFDTTGENMAGYGGARNMGFMLGPVILDAVRSGTSLGDIKPTDLVKKLQDSAMEDAVSIFMGDDGDYVSPGTVLSRAAIAQSSDERDPSVVTTERGGRDTTSVSSLVPNTVVDTLEEGGLEGFTAKLFGGNKWNNDAKNPGMGCAFSEPRFCLSLPTGKEESQLSRSATQGPPITMAMHLSGDRKSSPARYLKGNIAYTNMSECVASLLPPMGLPWNRTRADRGKELGDLMERIGSDEMRKDQQKTFMTALVRFSDTDGSGGGPLQLDGDQVDTVQGYIDSHPELDQESLDELAAIRDVYVDARRQARLIRRFIDTLFAKLSLGITDQEVLDATGKDRTGLSEQEAQILTLQTALEQDLSSVKDAIAEIRETFEDEGTAIDGSNRMVRDFILICENVGGGMFNDLAKTLSS